MTAPLLERGEFDPLRQFYGMWTLPLADRYRPVEGAPPAKYESAGGYLVMSPRGGSANSLAAGELFTILRKPARDAGHQAYTALNVQFHPGTWIEPDLVVLRKPVRGLTWVPAHVVLMPVKFVSPSSRRRDRIDKPRLCAEAGIPWYLRIELGGRIRVAEVELLRLDGDAYVHHTAARSGEQLTTEEPFPLRFDPAELLEP